MDSLTTFSIRPHTRFRNHEHPSVHVCVVLDGGYLERDGRGWRDVAPGTLRVSGAARHDIDFGPAGARCLVLEAAASTAEPALDRLTRPVFLQADGWLAGVVRRVQAAESRADPARDLVLDGLAAELLAQLARRLDGRRSSPPLWLERVRQQVQDTGGRVSVSSLAAEAQVHRVHLARAFREHFGVPVTDYARRVRVAVAHRLLVTTADSLALVAAQAGFADQSHLTRSLRATLGLTPGAIRRLTLPGSKTNRAAAGA